MQPAQNSTKRFKIRDIFLLLIFLSLSFSSALPAAAGKKDEAIKKAIVKIYVSKSSPDFVNPWRVSGPGRTSGSGCIIGGSRILTNAHVVADATFIEVRLHGQSKRYQARVLTVAHEADLALLTVDDEEFFKRIDPLKLGPLPEAQQEVLVHGFPIGGDSLSITKGILSRIEHQGYVHSGSYFLAGQIDAAINPGNSGGPVIVGGKIAGVVMQSYSPRHSESLGYMVPSPVIKHFLTDIKDGDYDTFPAIGLHTQEIENPGMKRWFGMTEAQTGVVINHIHFESPAIELLQTDDILMKIDGHPVSDDGTVEFRPNERTYYAYFIEMHQIGEEVNLEILRSGKVKKIRLPLKKGKGDFLLVPNKHFDRHPRYFIFGGIVFTPLTQDLMDQWGRSWRSSAPPELVAEVSNRPTKEKREVVLALKVLAADINRGYHGIRNWLTTEVNGRKFGDFKEFYEIVTGSEEPFLVFKNDKGYQLVIDREKALESHDELLKTYRIREDRSEDLETPSE